MRRFVARLHRLLTAALPAMVWLGCAPDAPDVTGLPDLSRSQQQGLEQAMRAQERHTPALLSRGDVVGTAVGLDAGGNPVIHLYLTRGGGALPAMLDGFRVVTAVTGPILTLAQDAQTLAPRAKPCPNPPCGGGGGDPVDPTARFARPVPIGVSTGHPDITAGTIGARVTDGGAVYALSNNHVFANENNATIGDNVLQPGAFDGGVDPADAIGTLFDYEPIAFGGTPNVIDAAIAWSSTDNLGNATPSNGYGMPRSATMAAAPGMRVKKYGRTTGQTQARVEAVNASVNVQYDGGVALFVGQVIVRGGSFSAGGDSGSLIVVNGGANDRRPVALLFAGGGGITVGNPIDAVLARFGVTIDGQ
ncbi:MAG TPA: hypothetical protein VD793_00290 [Gemmatimonadales bacterium]|nr:hypothetical protein [Gemmatimonadales bacterium]